MVKKHGNLYDKLCSWDNLLLAHQRAARHKKKYTEVMQFENNLEENLKELQNELITCTYHTGEYRQKTIYEGLECKIVKRNGQLCLE